MNLEIGKKCIYKSMILQEEREYWVHLPDSYYDDTYLPQHYPVLYLLDGDQYFHLVTAIQNSLNQGLYASIPEMIVVGILNPNRSRDLTPTYSTSDHPKFGQDFTFPESGGGDAFLDFLEKELMPEINSHYRTKNYNVFTGHSFGGLMVLHSFLSRPHLFNAWISMDPSLWWDDYFILKIADDSLHKNEYQHKTLYLGQAPFSNSEHPPKEVLSFRDKLQQYSHNNLRWKYQYFGQENHGTVQVPAIHKGLPFLLEGYRSDVKKVIAQPQLLTESYQQLSAVLGCEFNPAEQLVDAFGSFCIERDKLSTALTFFKMNRDLYPCSPHAYLQLGNVYSQSGEKERAMVEYNKALELDSSYQLVIDKLKR